MIDELIDDIERVVVRTLSCFFVMDLTPDMISTRVRVRVENVEISMKFTLSKLPVNVS